ncbi:hypothetical protein [Krasilnikovia sp. MM14-A1004]|uniref:hypothetical protein n=1 Tax=Krasilnikovia sp. MM14-A1004 TaxID=3373541 RepID=UPI00399D43C3
MACAIAHAVGILFAHPLVRYAELLSLGLLLGYAFVTGLHAPRWAVPSAFAVLLIDAIRTLPAESGGHGYGWQVLQRATEVDPAPGFASGVALTWASLTAITLLLLAWRRGGWHRRTVAGAAVAACLVIGYAAVRVIDIGHDLRARDLRYSDAPDTARTMTAVVAAVVPATALGLTAIALAAALAGHRRRLAAAGAALLAVVALPHLDASIGAVPLPLYAGDSTALFAWHAIAPTLAMRQPVPALTAAVELTAYLLLAVGLSRAHPTAGPPERPTTPRAVRPPA